MKKDTPVVLVHRRGPDLGSAERLEIGGRHRRFGRLVLMLSRPLPRIDMLATLWSDHEIEGKLGTVYFNQLDALQTAYFYGPTKKRATGLPCEGYSVQESRAKPSRIPSDATWLCSWGSTRRSRAESPPPRSPRGAARADVVIMGRGYARARDGDPHQAA